MQHDKDFLDALNRSFDAECEKLNATDTPEITPSARFTANMAHMLRHQHKRRKELQIRQVNPAERKARISEQKFSLVQLITSTLATAAVIGIVIGSVALIASMKQTREPMIPATESSSSDIAADSTEPAVTTSTAAITVDASEKMPVIPEEEQNFLGGRGEIVTVTPARGNAAHPVLRDDVYLYWEQYRTCIEKDSSSVLTQELSAEYLAKYHSLLSDGSTLFYADDTRLYTIDSNGSKTLLYTVPDVANMIFTHVLNLGTMDNTDPWYFISGYRGMDSVNALFPFAMVYQPATDTELDLTDRIGMSGDAQWEFQTDGSTMIGLDCSTHTLLVFPRPEVMTDQSANADIQQLWLSEQELPRILSWQLADGKVTYVCSDTDKTLLCEYSLTDGTTRTRELDAPSDDTILTPKKLFRVTQQSSKTDSSRIDITVTMTDLNTLLNGGEELDLWVIREMKTEDVHALRAAGDDVVLFSPATGQRALYAPFWTDESN